MNQEEFSKIVEDGIERTRKVLTNRGEVYARGCRLSNFKKAGEAQSCTPESALLGMFMKHFVKFIDMVDDIEDGDFPEIEQVQETTGDMRNYLHLFEALCLERIRKMDK